MVELRKAAVLAGGLWSLPASEASLEWRPVDLRTGKGAITQCRDVNCLSMIPTHCPPNKLVHNEAT